jgi:hypothetical protein
MQSVRCEEGRRHGVALLRMAQSLAPVQRCVCEVQALALNHASDGGARERNPVFRCQTFTDLLLAHQWRFHPVGANVLNEVRGDAGRSRRMIGGSVLQCGEVAHIKRSIHRWKVARAMPKRAHVSVTDCPPSTKSAIHRRRSCAARLSCSAAVELSASRSCWREGMCMWGVSVMSVFGFTLLYHKCLCDQTKRSPRRTSMSECVSALWMPVGPRERTFYRGRLFCGRPGLPAFVRRYLDLCPACARAE